MTSVVDSRRYVGMTFGISTSVPDPSEGPAPFNDDYVNRLVFQQTSHILLEGGRLVLGHRWKTGGILEHLASHAFRLRSYRQHQSGELPPIENLLAWPYLASDDQQAQLMIKEGILSSRQVLPEGIEVSQVEPDSDFGKYCRIRSYTAMRKTMIKSVHVQLAFGGRAGKRKWRLPGVIEEAVFAIQFGRPLYITSSLGGTCQLIVNAILQRSISLADRVAFETPDDVRDLITSHCRDHNLDAIEGPSGPNGTWSALEFFQKQNIETLSNRARMSPTEYINLMTTSDVDRALLLMSVGSTRYRQSMQS